MERAACRVNGPMWFSTAAGHRQAAKDICNTVCPVQPQCLERVLSAAWEPKSGIWAGYSISELHWERKDYNDRKDLEDVRSPGHPESGRAEDDQQ